jgi:vacuolar protein sorting-associated protein VTA1
LSELKAILGRAETVESKDPRMGYYLRQYAADRGVQLHRSSKDKAAGAFLGLLLSRLEDEQAVLTTTGVLPDDPAAYVKGFSMRLFKAADDGDRSGVRTMNIAKTFLMAAGCFEAVALWGAVPENVAEKIKYAKWRALEITRACKAGTVAEEPPYQGDPSEESETDVPEPQVPVAPQNPKPAVSSHQSDFSGAFTTVKVSQGSVPPMDVVNQARKQVKEALSALQFDDVRTAVELLRGSLAKLEPYV